MELEACTWLMSTCPEAPAANTRTAPTPAASCFMWSLQKGPYQSLPDPGRKETRSERKPLRAHARECTTPRPFSAEFHIPSTQPVHCLTEENAPHNPRHPSSNALELQNPLHP